MWSPTGTRCFLCVLPLRLCVSRALALEGFFACLRLSLLSRWNSCHIQLVRPHFAQLRGVGVSYKSKRSIVMFLRDCTILLLQMFENTPKTGRPLFFPKAVFFNAPMSAAKLPMLLRVVRMAPSGPPAFECRGCLPFYLIEQPNKKKD